jgi:hypothetical protein
MKLQPSEWIRVREIKGETKIYIPRKYRNFAISEVKRLGERKHLEELGGLYDMRGEGTIEEIRQRVKDKGLSRKTDQELDQFIQSVKRFL